MRIMDIAKIFKDYTDIKHKIEDLLPELIRKLIKDTSSTITYNRFPSRDATSTPGVDGIVRNDTQCEFIPVGESFWEIGTSGLEKINSDYETRTNEFDEEIRKNTIFILVFPKHWHFKTSLVKWQNERKSHWKDVIVYDAEILNNWLEEHPNIVLWFLKELGITQNLLNCNLVEIAYEDLINCTEPKLNSQIFCEERKVLEQTFIDELTSQKIVYVKSESRFESLGFVLSLIVKNGSVLAKDEFLVVNDRESYNFINKTLKDKILILNFDNTNELKVENNKIIIPCYKSNFSGKGIDLKVRGQRVMSKLLADIGLDSQQCTDINYKSNGNLLIIRRLLAKDLVDRQPKWANSQDDFCIAPLMLLQNFEITNESHLKIAEFITGYKRDLFLQKISTFQDVEDCPFRVVGNVYQLYNLEEAWFTLKKYMSSVLFDKICKILKFLFNKEQPSSEINLTTDGIRGSNINAVFKIFAFFAIDSDENQMLVDSFVNSILDLEKTNYNLFIKNLHMLTECSPKSICQFLDKQIELKSEFILTLLNSNDYCYLLSSINFMLCLEQYKFQAFNMIFKISNYNIKYAYSNNPQSDLCEALTPYFNKNALSIEDKLNLLKAKIEEDSNMVKLYIKIITSTSCCIPISFNVRKPECSNMPTVEDLNKFRKELDKNALDKTLEKNNNETILAFIDDYYMFHPNLFREIAKHLNNNRNAFSEDFLYQVFNSTIKQLATIRRFQHDENWVYKKSYIEPFSMLIENSKPKDLFMQYKYMFEDGYNYFDIDDNEKELDHEEIENKQNNLRVEALNTLVSSIGINSAISIYINNVSDNAIWGSLLADVFNDNISLDLIFDCCIQNKKFNLLSGVMNKATDKNIMVKIFKTKVDLLTKKYIIPLLYSKEYEILCENDDELELFYSSKSVGIQSEIDDATYQNFLKYNPIGLLDYFYDKVLDDELYNKGLELLDVLKTKQSKIKHKHYLWEIQEMFKELQSYKYCEELALLELQYLDIFEHLYPEALVEYWFRNPQKLIEYFNNVKKDKYSKIYHLQFDLVLKKEHYDNERDFLNFCNTLLDEQNIGLTALLGCIIGKACVGSDSIFPHESARRILEKNNECINRNFTTGYINSIGARFVGDGTKEFIKAKEFEENAKKLAMKYPITSSLLIKLRDFHDRTGNEDRKYDLLGI